MRESNRWFGQMVTVFLALIFIAMVAVVVMAIAFPEAMGQLGAQDVRAEDILYQPGCVTSLDLIFCD